VAAVTVTTGMGEVVTVCQPHYDETINIGNLLGMACADVTLTMLQDVGADRTVSGNVKQDIFTCAHYKRLLKL